jgi:TonB family protein
MHNPQKLLQSFRGTALALAAFVLTSCGYVASHAEKPQDRLLTAATHSQLDAPGLKPWHLKLDVTLYDSDGSNPVAGTIERWNAPNGNRTVFTFGDETRTILNDGDKFYASHSGPEVPILADSVLEAIMRPGPSEHDIQTSSPETTSEDFGKVKLDCIMLTEAMAHKGSIAIGLFPTYCLDPGGELLRASFNFGSYTVLRNDISEFQGQFIAHTIALIQGARTHVAEARITTLETFTPSSNQFATDDSMKPASPHTPRLAGGIMAGQIVKKVAPIYPASARQSHIGGTVVLAAIIGRDGHIRSLRPISAPDTDLALAAIDAVRQWTYKPYLLNGEPTDVDTTITVNFNLN